MNAETKLQDTDVTKANLKPLADPEIAKTISKKKLPKAFASSVIGMLLKQYKPELTELAMDIARKNSALLYSLYTPDEKTLIAQMFKIKSTLYRRNSTTSVKLVIPDGDSHRFTSTGSCITDLHYGRYGRASLELARLFTEQGNWISKHDKEIPIITSKENVEKNPAVLPILKRITRYLCDIREVEEWRRMRADIESPEDLERVAFEFYNLINMDYETSRQIKANNRQLIAYSKARAKFYTRVHEIIEQLSVVDTFIRGCVSYRNVYLLAPEMLDLIPKHAFLGSSSSIPTTEITVRDLRNVRDVLGKITK